MTLKQEWKKCEIPEIGDIIKWNEPLWAAPNKPRGKRDKIGVQEITAKLINIDDILKLNVVNVQKITSGELALTVKINDEIRRRLSSIQKGDCQRLLEL